MALLPRSYVVALAAVFSAIIFFAGLTATVAAQDGNPVMDIQALFTSIGGLVAAVVALFGLLFAVFQKLNEKLKLVDDSTIQKITMILNELKDTDLWSLENEQRLGAVLTFIYNTSPEGKKFMDEHAIDVRNLSASSDETKKQIEELYRKLTETMTKSPLK